MSMKFLVIRRPRSWKCRWGVGGWKKLHSEWVICFVANLSFSFGLGFTLICIDMCLVISEPVFCQATLSLIDLWWDSVLMVLLLSSNNTISRKLWCCGDCWRLLLTILNLNMLLQEIQSWPILWVCWVTVYLCKCRVIFTLDRGCKLHTSSVSAACDQMWIFLKKIYR